MELDLRKAAGVSLSKDIIFDVLTRLPAKQLCRLRCVCKGWRALISDEAFVAAQKSRAGPLIVGVFRPRCFVEEFELRVMDMAGNVLRVFKDVAGSLSPMRLDFICLYTIHGGAMIVDPAAAGRPVLTVGECNPSPGTPYLVSHCSFGRAAPSGAYKIHRIYETPDGLGQLCEIATMINDLGVKPPTAWRQTPRPPFFIRWFSDHKVTVNGILHFMSDPADDVTDQDWNRIATFSLESERWTETIEGPAMGPVKDRKAFCFALTELMGTLSMVETVYKHYRRLGRKDDHHVNIGY